MPTVTKPDVKYVDPVLAGFDPKKPDERKLLKVKDVLTPRGTQVRVDTDSGQVVDVKRAEGFAAAMKVQHADGKGKVTFPPMKVMLVTDMPGNKEKEVYVGWDGLHTHAGYEMAFGKNAELPCHIWKGTWAQALAAAASLANVEHEQNGKPKSYKDKMHSLHVYAKSLEAAGVAKKEWPSNRDAGLMFGVSHTAVGDEDPFDRRKADTKTKAEKLAEKKTVRQTGAAVQQAGAAHLNGPALPKFEVIRQATKEVVGTYEAESAVKALEAHKDKTPGARLTDFTTRDLTPAGQKSGQEKLIGFDWTKMEHDLGAMARGLDGMGDLYDLKQDKNWVQARGSLNNFATLFRELKTTALKPKAKADPKKDERAVPKKGEVPINDPMPV